MPKGEKHNDKAIVLIKKSNNLVESRYKFDIWETRFFLSILSQIRRDDTDLRTYRIWYKDIIKTFGLNSGDAYASLRDAAKSLIRKPVRMSYYNNGVKREQEVSLITQIDYMVEGKVNVESNEYIDVMVQENMKPFLLQLQKNFTAYDLRNVVKLGVYSVRIYELLKQYESIATRTLTISELKTMFELSTEYQKYNDFYRWVIKPSEEEINQFTDIQVLNIEKIKEGRKVTALRFKFRKKTDAEMQKMQDTTMQDREMVQDAEYEEAADTTEAVSTPKEQLVVELSPVVVTKFGVSLKVFMDLVEAHTEGAVRKAVQITQKALQAGKVANAAGFFVQAIRAQYEDNAEKKIAAENKLKEDKKAVLEAKKASENAESKQKKQKNEKDAALFEQQKAIFNRLIEEDETFWLELEEHIRMDNLMRNSYDFGKDVFENMQKPMISGIVMAIATKLRPHSFGK